MDLSAVATSMPSIENLFCFQVPPSGVALEPRSGFS